MDKLVYAVIDKNDNIVDILENFDDAFNYAWDIKAPYIEILKNFDGEKGEVIETYNVNYEIKMAKQKILAIILFIVSAITIPLLNGEISVAIFLIPLSIILFMSKEYWIAD